jgi:hypothetical protein
MVNEILFLLNSNSSAITALSILSAGIVWVLSLPFNTYREEILTIAKWEKITALNEVAIRDNVHFMNEWLTAIAGSRPYSCYFETLLTGDFDSSFLSDLKLTNQLIKLNYMSKRTSDDLKNLYISYWDTLTKITALSDPSVVEILRNYHDSVSTAIIGIKKSHITIHKEILPVLASLQVGGTVRFHSIFGYARFLSTRYIWPRPTEKKINDRLAQLVKEMRDKDFVIEE